MAITCTLPRIFSPSRLLTCNLICQTSLGCICTPFDRECQNPSIVAWRSTPSMVHGYFIDKMSPARTTDTSPAVLQMKPSYCLQRLSILASTTPRNLVRWAGQAWRVSLQQLDTSSLGANLTRIARPRIQPPPRRTLDPNRPLLDVPRRAMTQASRHLRPRKIRTMTPRARPRHPHQVRHHRSSPSPR